MSTSSDAAPGDFSKIEDNDYVTLVSSDGHEFLVAREAACVSGVIRQMLDPKSGFAEAKSNRAHFKDITGVVLEKVVEYFYHNLRYSKSSQKAAGGKAQDPPDFEFPLEMCLELLVAADFLNT